ncbi:alpha/beta hydrolase [Pseudonocardia sp. ICBG601]|uniref:alpha/beta hydrolase n=1 Tax=Pseudonocardia sp. ICBG601 TaxID=2846759 RepID=UPI001CF6E582|nr:alpha/beta hydrolase [Pseudonocardia sp. ICBG601]
MKFLYDDESFSFEALRAAGYAPYGGAELGEVLVTCRAIPEGDEVAWSTRWAATAARVERIGRDALADGHRVSAREALLRASNYYRTADFYRREDPARDQESVRLQTASRRTFADAAALLDTPARALEIPYEGTTLPAYLFTVDGSGVPRPTVIYHGGYDSTLEEDYFALAAGALRRGYNVLAFDGPGQGATVRAGLHFRPDWEAVVTPVVDVAVTLPRSTPRRSPWSAPASVATSRPAPPPSSTASPPACSTTASGTCTRPWQAWPPPQRTPVGSRHSWPRAPRRAGWSTTGAGPTAWRPSTTCSRPPGPTPSTASPTGSPAPRWCSKPRTTSSSVASHSGSTTR